MVVIPTSWLSPLVTIIPASRIYVNPFDNTIINIINIVTSMQSIQEVVHIIPLGHEYDRAVKPFEERKADRVHLLSVADITKYPEEMLERQAHFTKKVTLQLEGMGIRVVPHSVDLFNILEVMNAISKIITDEKTHGNHVLVNMSACGRLTSVGATLAAMAHDATVYYMSADDYSMNEDDFLNHGLSICERKKIIRFENFQFVLPDKISTAILVELCTQGRGITTKDIRNVLHVQGVPGFEKDTDSIPKASTDENQRLEKTKQLIKMEKRYLEPLERSGYIRRERSGRNNIISITESGKYVAHISGALKN